MIKSYFKLISLFSFLTIFTFSSHAALYTSIASGDWTGSNTFDLGAGPSLSGAAGGCNDDVTISAGHTVTLTGNLQIKSGKTLIVNGYLIINGDVDFQNGCTILVNSGGTLEIDNGENSNNSTDVTINGTIICNSDFDAGVGSSMSGSGSMTVHGTSSGSGTIFGNATGGTGVNFSSSGTEAESYTDCGTQGVDFATAYGPLDYEDRYTYYQHIYLQPEIGSAGNITRIGFQLAGVGNYDETTPVKVYMAHTTKEFFTSTTDWISVTSSDLVYDGNYFTPNALGWYYMNLDTPFNYNNSDHLVISVVQDRPSSHDPGNNFMSHDKLSNRTITKTELFAIIDPEMPLAPADAIYSNVPNLRVSIQDATPSSVTWTGNGDPADWSNGLNWSTGAPNFFRQLHHSLLPTGGVFPAIELVELCWL